MDNHGVIHSWKRHGSGKNIIKYCFNFLLIKKNWQGSVMCLGKGWFELRSHISIAGSPSALETCTVTDRLISAESFPSQQVYGKTFNGRHPIKRKRAGLHESPTNIGGQRFTAHSCRVRSPRKPQRRGRVSRIIFYLLINRILHRDLVYCFNGGAELT